MPNYVSQMSKDSGEAYLVKDTAARQQISDETTARESAIAAEVTAREDAIAAEATAREDAIAAEATAREDAIAAEATAREDAIAAEATAREDAIAAEASTREAEISVLQSAFLLNIPSKWLESGGIKDDGTEEAGTSRIRSKFIKTNGSILIRSNSPYQFIVYNYDTNLSFTGLGTFTSEEVVSNDGYIRLKFRNVNTPSSDIHNEIYNVAESTEIPKVVIDENLFFEEYDLCGFDANDLAVGNIAQPSGTEYDDPKRIRSRYFKSNGYLKVVPNIGYSLVAVYFDDNLVYSSDTGFLPFLETNYTGFLRLKFKKNSEQNITVQEAVNNVSINHEFYDFNKRYTIDQYGIKQYGISTSGLDQYQDKTRCSTDYIPANGFISIGTDKTSPYEVVAYKYDKNFNFIEQVSPTTWVNEIATIHNGYIRAKFRNKTTPSADISSETEAIRSSLYVWTEKVQETDIIHKFNDLANDRIIESRICVSDTNKTCASAAEIVYDTAKGQVYVVYLSSNTHYGEQRDIVMMTKFSVANPNNKTHYVIAENGTVIDGVNIVYPYEPNILRFQDELLISFYVDGQYYVRRFDIATEQLSATLEKMKIKYGGNEFDMDDQNVSDYYSSNNAVFGTYTIFTCRHEEKNGIFYSAISSNAASGNAVLCLSDDGITWELLSILPGICQYEEQLAFVGDTLYAFGRTDSRIYKSIDMGQTWSTYIDNILSSGTRPQLINYKNSLLSLLPSTENVPDYIGWSGRNIIDINLATSYKTRIKSKYGIVYPAVFIVYNDIYIVFSNGELFAAEYQSDGKDALFVAKIGELY